MKLPYNPAIPLLGIYLNKTTVIWKDIHTPMFVAALFTISKTWKQPGCSLTDKCIKKIRCKYAMEDYSAIARMKFVLFVMTWMDPEDVMPSEIRERRIPQDLTYI